MKNFNSIEEKNINSLVDGELDAVESALLLEQLEQQPELQRELCDTHRIKDMMKMAYPVTNTEKNNNQDFGKGWFVSIAASIVLLMFGFISGSYFNTQTTIETVQLNQSATQQQKLVLFIGNSDNKKFAETLNKAEAFLKKYQHQNVEVNVVVSAGGIDLLRNGHSLFISRIQQLSETYDSLDFVACNNTIARLKQQGKKISIIDQALVAPSAVEFVVKRLQQGWLYHAI